MSLFQKRLLALGILYDKDGGGGGLGAPEAPTPGAKPITPDAGGGDDGTKGDSITSIRESIKETSKKLPQAKSPLANAIPYEFEEDDAGDGGEGPTPDPSSVQEDPDPIEPDPDDSDQPDEGKTPDPDSQFYDPEVHAKDKEVYPNAYKTRIDAEYATVPKIEMYQEKAEKLQEVGSEVGATVPAEIQEQIEKFKDVTVLAEASDDEVREFVINLDLANKSIDEKYKTVSQRYKQNEQIQKTTQEYKEAEKAAQTASREIGLDKRIHELPENAEFKDLLALADQQIETVIAPLNEQIKKHENDEKLVSEKGHKEWLAKLRDLESQRDQKMEDLKEYRQSLIKFNDARIKREEVQSKQPVRLTDKERLAKMDQTFTAWAEDRSTGKFALDIFTQSDSTDPVRYLRKFAFSPKNINKFDLTTKSGWDKMTDLWKKTMAERSKAEAAKQTPGQQDQKKTSKVRSPIPNPPIKRGNNVAIGGNHDEMEKARERIRQNSAAYFNG